MRRISRYLRCLVLVVAGAVVGSASGEGIGRSPVPVGPFLNGIFPTKAPGPGGSWTLVDAFPHLTFVDPVRIAPDPRAADHVFVVCRSGEIWRVPFSPDAKKEDKVKVLDLRATTLGFGDSGMMSLAFHPDFGVPENPNRGYVYVFYQYVPQRPANTDPATPSYLRLSRFRIPDGESVIDPESELVMIQQFDRHAWHTGGGMFFGADRYLYLALGDEGGSKDFYHSGQKINDRLFAGILRIDVDQDLSRSHPVRRKPAAIPVPAGWPESFTQGYSIPDDNPWLDKKGGVLEEFWSIGTRNPHSMCLDDETGEIMVADVGQDSREEITIARKGGNHEWPFMEGKIAGPAKKPAKIIGKAVPPVFDYSRAMGGCVIGGMVYRGSAHAGTLTGKYIFGDHSSRGVYALDRADDGAFDAEFLTSIPRGAGEKKNLSGISEGPDGEPYFIELGEAGTDTGKILRLERTGPSVPEPPRLLSETGAFKDVQHLVPSPTLLPYGVISPLWTDGAAKQRWVAIPNDGSHDSDDERVKYREKGEWDFPVGTVLVKHFALPLDERHPEKATPIETRFFVHGEDGGYYGVTYRWNEQGTDAVLISKRENRKLQVTGTNGKPRSQQWTFPSRSDCLTCHTPDAGSVLGPRSHQLAGNYGYPEGVANQLETWNQLGIFGDSFGQRDVAKLPHSVDPRDTKASLDQRVKSYLDANCAHCHHPGGVAANFDASFNAPLSSQRIVKGMVNRPLHGLDDRVVAPGDVGNSVLHGRLSASGAKQMPPIGRNVVNQAAVALIEDWIKSLDPDSFPPNTQRGLQADYYNGSNFDEMVVSRTDPSIDFNWGDGSPAEDVSSDRFSVRWHGEVHAPVSGSYTFIANNDDGIRVIVNGSKIIDSWADQPATERSGPILLNAERPADIIVEYYKATKGSVVRLEWIGPSGQKEVIPEEAFRRSSVTNQQPIAENDHFTLKRGSTLKLDVLENDIGLNAPLGIHGVAICDSPRHGTVRIDGAARRLIYTHDGSGAPADSFSYTVTDSRGMKSDPAAVSLTISR